MRKLLIVDPSLISLEGHSYNYDVAIYEAAKRVFDAVRVYADLGFRDPSGRLGDVQAVLNRLRIDRLKGLANRLFHRRNEESSGDSAHATVVPGVWPWLIDLAKWLRAKDLGASLRTILRREQGPGDEIHVFFQHAHFSELVLASRMKDPVHLHLVLRYSPELVNSGRMPKENFGALLKALGRSASPRVHLYTDSERLSREYAALGAGDVHTLPVPILVPSGAAQPSGDAQTVRVSFLGAARVEKGFAELARLVERFPREAAGRKVSTLVQVSSRSPDPRVQEATRELASLAARMPGALELVESPVAMDRYYGLVAGSGIVVLPYLSAKYNASTSGIFVEALCFGVPVICPAESWMADVIAEAERRRGLKIGEAVGSIGEIPAAIGKIAAAFPAYREAVRRFAGFWRETHNADACVRVLLAAASA